MFIKFGLSEQGNHVSHLFLYITKMINLMETQEKIYFFEGKWERLMKIWFPLFPYTQPILNYTAYD